MTYRICSGTQMQLRSLLGHPRISAPFFHLDNCPRAHAFSIPKSLISTTDFRKAGLLDRSFCSGKLGVNYRYIVVSASPGEVDITVEDDAMERMEKCLESVQRNFSTIRTGRANPAMLDRIEVDYYGSMTPLKQIAGVSTPEASLLVIQPYDAGAIPAIERAIQQSDIGLTPNNDGKLIRLQIPQLTAERRKEMTKVASKLGEEGKVAIRNVRRDAMKSIEKLEKDGVIGKDERSSLENSIQKLTDEYIKQVESIIKAKSEELAKI